MQPKRTVKRKIIEFTGILFVSLLLFGLSFRFISIPFFLLWILVYWFSSEPRYERRLNCALLLFAISLFIPADIDIRGWRGPRYGSGPDGPHFVRLVKGMPMHGKLLQTYGEYISGGCVSFGLEPSWILVLN